MGAIPENNGPDWIGRSRVEAENLGHHFIAPEHVFLALADAKETKIVDILAQLGCHVEEMAQVVKKIMTHVDPGKSRVNIPLTRSASNMLKHSFLESRSRKADAIDERDILLAMLQDRQSILAIVMKQHCGIGYEEVKAML